MKNPWTAKNPFMSLWLSAANTAMNTARGQVSAAAQREINRASQTAFDEAVSEWTRIMTPPWAATATAPRRHRRRRAHR